jgi:hypothetical protein
LRVSITTCGSASMSEDAVNSTEDTAASKWASTAVAAPLSTSSTA